MQTSKRVLPVEQLQRCLAEHEFAPSSSGGAGGLAGGVVGLTWAQLQGLILVRSRARGLRLRPNGGRLPRRVFALYPPLAIAIAVTARGDAPDPLCRHRTGTYCRRCVS